MTIFSFFVLFDDRVEGSCKVTKLKKAVWLKLKLRGDFLWFLTVGKAVVERPEHCVIAPPKMNKVLNGKVVGIEHTMRNHYFRILTVDAFQDYFLSS